MSKVALVTGGARGIGLGISECLAREGWDLALCGMREPTAVADSLARLSGFRVRVHYTRADVGDSADRAALVEDVKSRYGAVDLLVNNAGVAPLQRKDILDATEESFERVWRTNVQGPYFLTQAVARWMIERGSAGAVPQAIINISSISATTASVNRGEYCISKAGISMATALWAARLAAHGILVYEIRPGVIQTDMSAPARQKYDALIADGLLLQSRWGTPADVGKSVAMLARGDLAYSTGQVVMVDGGFNIRRL